LNDDKKAINKINKNHIVVEHHGVRFFFGFLRFDEDGKKAFFDR